jgi:hypothetical protein
MDEFVREFKVARRVSAQLEKEYIFEFCNKYGVSS